MEKNQSASYQQRVIRVFISSTFKDMQAEREELVKFTFPELRRRCRERRVEFVGVDLRWGITDEQTAEGKVLPICLAEIEGCRPYFIGLLGERYGWVPHSIDEDLIHREPWLKEHKEKSVTELEILHGVLNDPAMKGLAFFYFRNKEASDAIEELLSKEPAYMPEPEASRAKLDILKQRIEASAYPLKKDYADAKTLGQWVLDDLWSAIDKRYPIEGVPTELEQRRMEHEAFASLRRKVYIGRKDYYDRLNEHAAGDGPPLVILGESGSGKSALLANWAYAYQQEHPEDLIVSHYVGSTADSADYIHILKRIMEEIKERYEPDTEQEGDISRYIADRGYIPTNPKKIPEAFPKWLARAAAKGRLILILDALNQLEDRDNASELGWLPRSFSPNVRLIVSTLPGRSLDALKKRNWPEMIVGPMKVNDQKDYMTQYLSRYGKALEDSQVHKILAAKQTTNPLYMRTLLEELRVFGKHNEVDTEIDRYLKAETVEGLFVLVLDRLEKAYEREREGLVAELTTLLWASRMGLSETEILELLGAEDSPMPRALFSPLYLALEDSLVNRSGLLTFFHDFLRSAVESKYLKDPQSKQKAHLKIADYFDRKVLDDRKVDELPWQLFQGVSWQRLKDCVSDMEVLPRMISRNKQYELMKYWQALADRFDMVSAYNYSIGQYESRSPYGNNLAYRLNQTAFFLMLCGNYRGAEPLFHKALNIRTEVLGPNHLFTATSCMNLAWLYETMGLYDEALSLYYRAFEIRERVLQLHHVDTADVLANVADVLEWKGDYIGAEAFYQQTYAIRADILGSEHPSTASCLHSLSWLYFSTDKHEEALSLCQQALSIREDKLGPEHPDTASSLNNLALIYLEKGDYNRALPLIQKALEINEKIYGPDHPEVATNLTNYAQGLMDIGDYDRAEACLRRGLNIREKTFGKDHPITAYSVSWLGQLFEEKGDYASAEQSYLRTLAIQECVPGPEHPDTASTLHCLSWVYYCLGKCKEALPLCQRALSIREKTFGQENPNTADTLNNLSLIYRAAGDNERALPLIQKALQINEKIYGPDHPAVATNLTNYALVLTDIGDYDRAEVFLRRGLEVREKALGTKHKRVVNSLNNLAWFLEKKGDHNGAMMYRQRARDIAQERTKE